MRVDRLALPPTLARLVPGCSEKLARCRVSPVLAPRGAHTDWRGGPTGPGWVEAGRHLLAGLEHDLGLLASARRSATLGSGDTVQRGPLGHIQPATSAWIKSWTRPWAAEGPAPCGIGPGSTLLPMVELGGLEPPSSWVRPRILHAL